MLDVLPAVKFGFHELWIDGRDFYLNGSRIFLSAVPLDNAEISAAAAFMTYRPGGPTVNHPRAANFVRKLTEGPYAGRYIYWFHNNNGRGYEGRNPAYLLGGVEHDSLQGKVIYWGEPVAVLYAKDPKVRISYPDFIWDDGLYITETQKTAARVHAVPAALLRSLWTEGNASAARNIGMYRHEK